jgi:putative flippase GtrA
MTGFATAKVNQIYLTAKNHAGRLIRYSIIGVLNTLLYGFLLIYCTKHLGMSSVAAVTVSFALTMIFQFSANRYFTYNAQGHLRRQIHRYLWTTAFNYVVSLILVVILADGLHIAMEWVVLICGATMLALGYLFGYVWVFRGEKW